MIGWPDTLDSAGTGRPRVSLGKLTLPHPRARRAMGPVTPSQESFVTGVQLICNSPVPDSTYNNRIDRPQRHLPSVDIVRRVHLLYQVSGLPVSQSLVPASGLDLRLESLVSLLLPPRSSHFPPQPNSLCHPELEPELESAPTPVTGESTRPKHRPEVLSRPHSRAFPPSHSLRSVSPEYSDSKTSGRNG